MNAARGVVQDSGRTWLSPAAVVVVVALLAAFPLVAGGDFWLRIAIFIWMNGLLALSLHVIFRAGQLSLAQAAFMAVGAYTSAQMTLAFNLPFVAAFVLAGAMAGLVAIPLGLVVLRLRSVYFVLATFALNEFTVIFSKILTPVTGGNTGLPGIPAATIPIVDIVIADNTSYYYLVMTVTLVALLFVVALYRSRIGHAMSSVGSSELLAASSGLNPMRVKVFAFSVSAAMAGLGGSLFAHYMTYIAPTDFTFWKSVELLIMIVVGGLNYVIGPLLGSIFITPVPELFRAYRDWQQILNGLVLLLAVLVFPQGIAHVIDRVRELLARLPHFSFGRVPADLDADEERADRGREREETEEVPSAKGADA